MSAKVHVCYKVEYVFSHQVLSIDGSDVTLSSGYSFSTLKTRKAEINEQGQRVKAGNLVTQKLTIVSDLNLDQANDINGHLILRLTLSDGRVIIWGTIDNPVLRETLDKEISAGKLVLARQSTEFEI